MNVTSSVESSSPLAFASALSNTVRISSTSPSSVSSEAVNSSKEILSLLSVSNRHKAISGVIESSISTIVTSKICNPSTVSVEGVKTPIHSVNVKTSSISIISMPSPSFCVSSAIAAITSVWEFDVVIE